MKAEQRPPEKDVFFSWRPVHVVNLISTASVYRNLIQYVCFSLSPCVCVYVACVSIAFLMLFVNLSALYYEFSLHIWFFFCYCSSVYGCMACMVFHSNRISLFSLSLSLSFSSSIHPIDCCHWRRHWCRYSLSPAPQSNWNELNRIEPHRHRPQRHRHGTPNALLELGRVTPGTYCTRQFDECYRKNCRLQSPNYPGMYPRNVTCYWTIRQKSVPTCKHAMIAISQENSHKSLVKRYVWCDVWGEVIPGGCRNDRFLCIWMNFIYNVYI